MIPNRSEILLASIGVAIYLLTVAVTLWVVAPTNCTDSRSQECLAVQDTHAEEIAPEAFATWRGSAH